MKKILLCSIVMLIISCNNLGGFRNDFFYMIFNDKNIDIELICSNDSKSLTSDGRFIQIYSMKNIDKKIILKNISNNQNIKDLTYKRYDEFSWKKTPATKEIFYFVNQEYSDELNFSSIDCFSLNELTSILLLNKKNYYALLKQRLGGDILLIWEVENEKLYLLSGLNL